VGAIFSASFQIGPGAHPTCSLLFGSLSPGVQQLMRGVDHPPLSIAEVKERVGIFFYFLSGLSWPVIG